MSDNINIKILASLERLEAGQTVAENALIRVEAGQAQLEAGQAQFDTRLTHFESRLGRVEASISQVRIDLMGRMDRLQDTITTIRDDIAVNYGTSDAARRANDNTRAEVQALSEIISTMGRQIQRLQTDVRTLKGEP